MIKRRALGNVTASVVQRASKGVQIAIAKYKFSEKKNYYVPIGGLQDTVNLFNFIKYLLIRLMYFRKIYLHVSFFSQRIFSNKEISLHASYLNEEI